MVTKSWTQLSTHALMKNVDSIKVTLCPAKIFDFPTTWTVLVSERVDPEWKGQGVAGTCLFMVSFALSPQLFHVGTTDKRPGAGAAIFWPWGIKRITDDKAERQKELWFWLWLWATKWVLNCLLWDCLYVNPLKSCLSHYRKCYGSISIPWKKICCGPGLQELRMWPNVEIVSLQK